MRTPLLADAADIPLGNSMISGLVARLIEALWLVTGAAMFLFTLFLAVLVVAGVGYRLGPRDGRRRHAAVFGISVIVVLAGATALALPHSYGNVQQIFRSRSPSSLTATPPRATTAYQTISGLPVRFKNGAATGQGLKSNAEHSLVLYDDGGIDPQGNELSATLLVNLISHFGDWTALSMSNYRSGMLAGYDAVFYLGAADAALPSSFLDEVTKTGQGVIWIGHGLDQVRARETALGSGFTGFTVQGTDTAALNMIHYRDTDLAANGNGGGGYARVEIDQPDAVTVLATANRSDGSTVPWAVRSGHLTFLADNPLIDLTRLDGRNLVLDDLLFDALDPGARTQHQALLRLEDVNPATDPAKLRAIVDYLYGEGVPFSIAVFPVYRDPNGVDGNGDVTIELTERPALVSALAYATAHGGSLVLHGYTHQYQNKANPANGRSGDDAEFYLCHPDAAQGMQLDGHVPEDSPAWALGRVNRALAEMKAAEVPAPSMFEFPHYLGSATDYLAIGGKFTVLYQRTLYFPGLLLGQQVNDARRIWQVLPYVVHDVYGNTIVPENMDYVSSDGTTIPRMLDQARSNLVVRDGVASFFYHPFLGVGQLPQLVDGLKSMGYTFVTARSLVEAS